MKSTLGRPELNGCPDFQPGGLAEGSRGLSAAIPPVNANEKNLPTMEGSQTRPASGPFWHPSGVLTDSTAHTGGIAALNPRPASFIPPG
jgi:hypothetical protein